MVVVQFFEKNVLILSQLLKNVPSVDENIKIKGRKGKVLGVNQIDDKLVQVHIFFEPVVIKKPLLKDTKNKKR